MIGPPIRIPHSDYIAIEISTSRDGGRISVDLLLLQQGRWLSGGASPSFPTKVLDSVIEGLQAMRDQMARDGSG